MNRLKKILHISLGLFLVFVGLAGLILPIINGTILLLLGCILLSFESKYVEYHLHRIAHKTTITGEWYEKLLLFMNKLFGRP
jgi:uncharacterized membrane protein YbaN (DUF454 family)